jgi:putative tricarboxylic transport membrane protein
MRIVFLLAVLGGAVFYSYIAFLDLNFLTRTGRLGPGFFPRIVGVGMVVTTIWALLDALRARKLAIAGGGPGEDEGSWRDGVTLILLALGYAILLRLFGGFVATVIYLGVALTILNPGRHLQNAAVAVILPACVYLLFDRLLNANMPPALFDLPF